MSTARTIELISNNGDCWSAAQRLLAVLAYPSVNDEKAMLRFVDAMHVGRLRWNRRILPPEQRPDLSAEMSAAPNMPAQQVDGTLRRGIKRVHHRLVAAEIFGRLALAYSCRMLPASNAALRLERDGHDIKSMRTTKATGKFSGPSVLSTIRVIAPHLRRSLPIGQMDQKAFMNIQDRIVRPSFPVMHLAHALLLQVERQRRSAAGGVVPEHWADRLLKRPAWVRNVVCEGMSAIDSYWIMMRAMGMEAPREAMIKVQLIGTTTEMT